MNITPIEVFEYNSQAQLPDNEEFWDVDWYVRTNMTGIEQAESTPSGKTCGNCLNPMSDIDYVVSFKSGETETFTIPVCGCHLPTEESALKVFIIRTYLIDQALNWDNLCENSSSPFPSPPSQN